MFNGEYRAFMTLATSLQILWSEKKNTLLEIMNDDAFGGLKVTTNWADN